MTYKVSEILKAVVVALSLANAAAGCSDETTEEVDSSPVGSIGLRLKLPSGTTVDPITYTIAGPTMTSGTIPAEGTGTTFSVTIDNLKPGTGYTITLSGKQSSGAKDCFGSQTFAVMSNVSTNVQVKLSCPGVRNSATGSVVVNGAVNICATVDSAAGSPSGDGSMISVSGSGSDADMLPSNTIKYTWTAPAGAGSFDDASSANTTFHCMADGAVTLTLADTDADCGDSMDVTVTCKGPGTCTPTVERVCSQGNPHWKDSCGNIDNKPIETCAARFGCAAGFCLSSPVNAASVGGHSSCALTALGSLKCWGSNHLGVLGNGSSADSHVPVQVTGLASDVTAVSVGWSTTACAVVSGGVHCWGSGSPGLLGNGSSADSDVPVQVTGLTSGATAVSVGENSACAVVSGGVKCWGANDFGELGNSETTDSRVPVQVTGLTSGVTAVSVGFASACAVVSGGVQCWGGNSYGQLGNGSNTDSSVPVQVAGLTSGVTAVSVGSYSACAVVSGGVQCWGANVVGELGNGSTTDSNFPVQVTGLTSGVASVSVGFASACAVASGGGIRCWGDNLFGQLGNGSTTESYVPVQVAGLTSGATAVSVGSYAACAAIAGGLQCWGGNSDGQLGNGSTTESNVPVQVTGL